MSQAFCLGYDVAALQAAYRERQIAAAEGQRRQVGMPGKGTRMPRRLDEIPRVSHEDNRLMRSDTVA